MTAFTQPLAGVAIRTTGGDAASDRIVSVSIHAMNETGTAGVRYSWRTDLFRRVPGGAPIRPSREVVGEVSATLKAFNEIGVPVVIFNAPKVLSFLAVEAYRHGVEFTTPDVLLDPYVLDYVLHPDVVRARTLDAVAESYQLRLPVIGDVGSVAEVSAGLFRVMFAQSERLQRLVSEGLLILTERQSAWYEDWTTSPSGEQKVDHLALATDRGWPISERAGAITGDTKLTHGLGSLLP